MSGYTYDRIWERLSALYNASSTSYHVSDLLSRWISERNLDWGYKLVDFYSARVPSAGSVGDAANEYWSGGVLSDALVWFDAEWSAVSSGVWKNLGTAGSSYGAMLGWQPASDSNDPTLLPWSGENYLYLPGIAGNYASVPDAAALDITGDIEIVARVAMNDWTQTGNACLVSKQNSYTLHVNATGYPYFQWYGTAGGAPQSTAPVPFADGQAGWLKVTWDADNGAAGNTARFYYAADQTTEPTSWTQLGSDVVTAGVGTIAVTATVLEVGSTNTGITRVTAGKFYRAIVRNGIGGSTVVDIDFTTGITSGGQTTFTATTGQTVTINRSTTGRKAVAVVRPVWLFGTDDYMQVPADPDGAYVTLNGTSQYVSCPDAAGLDVTGDLELEVIFNSAPDWATGVATNGIIFGKESASNRSYLLRQMNALPKRLDFGWSPDGSTAVSSYSTTDVPTGVNAIKVTHDVDNGAAGNDVKFYTSTDYGATYTQLGATVTKAGTTSHYAGTTELALGRSFYTGYWEKAASYRRAIVRNGIGGTIVADWQACGHPANREAYYDAYGNLWSMTGSPTLSNPNRLNFALGDSFTVLAVIRHWANPPSFARIVAKGSNSAQPNYTLFNHNANGKVYFLIASAVGVGTNTAGGVPTYSMGQSVVVTGIRNTATDKLESYFNTTDYGTAPTDPTTGAISNAQPLGIGGLPTQNDMELLAVAVFPRALTTTEIEAICRHYGTL